MKIRDILTLHDTEGYYSIECEESTTSNVLYVDYDPRLDSEYYTFIESDPDLAEEGCYVVAHNVDNDRLKLVFSRICRFRDGDAVAYIRLIKK